MIQLAFLLLFIAYPLIELAVLLWVGRQIGVAATLAIVIGSAILGLITVQRQGFSIVTRAQNALARGEAPVLPVAEGAFLFIAGILLILPGLIGDAVGLLLLIPPVRKAVAAWSLGRFATASITRIRVFRQNASRGDPTHRNGRPTGSEKLGPIIDGEYKRLDDSDDEPQNHSP